MMATADFGQHAYGMPMWAKKWSSTSPGKGAFHAPKGTGEFSPLL